MMSKRSRFLPAVAALLVCLAPLAAHAITPYSQDFEALVQTDVAALGNDGWVVYGNVFDSAMNYLYGYGVFPAPNDGAAFCAIAVGEGGVDQGLQQLSVYSDYNNLDHGAGNWIESNVFQEQTVLAGDVGKTFKYSFNAKLGNISGSSTAIAFIKTLNPAAGYATTNFITADMTAIPVTWQGYSLSITIDAGLVGQLIQFGFSNLATLYEPSGIFYDNVLFEEDTTSDVPAGFAAASAVLHGNYPNPFNPMTRIEFSLAVPGDVEIAVYDVAGRLVDVLQQGFLAAGDHDVIWDGRTAAGTPAATGLYHYVMRTAEGLSARTMVLLK